MVVQSDATVRGLHEAIRRHPGTALTAGIVMIVFGFVAVAAPFVTGLAITVIVGFTLLVSGASQCALAFRAGAFGHGLLMFLIGLVTLIAGFFLVTRPVAGLASITLFLAAYFLATGVLAIVAGFHLRPVKGWGIMLANGIVTLILGFLIWRQWPVSGIWALGVLFGVQLMMSGASLLAVRSAVRAGNDSSLRT
jgi:uncharacterized membrane protein HdeD (DUF308 family)